MKNIILIILFLSVSLCFSQSDSTFYFFDTTTPEYKVINKIKSCKNKTEKDFYKLILFARQRQSDSMSIYVDKLNKYKNIDSLKLPEIKYFTGFLNKITDQDSLFHRYSYEAYYLAEKQQDTITALFSLAGLSQTFDYENDKPYNAHYLNELKQKANQYNNNYFKIIHKFLESNYHLYRYQDSLALSSFNKLLKYNFTNKRDSIFLIYTYNNLGVLYEENLNKSDSAIFFYNKQIDFYKKNPNQSSNNKYFDIYNNLGNVYLTKNDLKKTETYFKLAETLKVESNKLYYSSLIKKNLSDLYEKKQNYKLAFTYLKESNYLNDSLNTVEQKIAVGKFDNQKLRTENAEKGLKNEKLRADKLVIEAQNKQNRNLLFAALGLLLFGGITAFLIQKNTKRKQLLAEQDKEIQKQKVSTLLKDQEVSSINAMIEGQEKERQRIANDLHDDLGGLMATVKLHFNSYREKQTEDLFNKTNTLINDAYTKIRDIAHAKNSGVIAKQGLLKAVENMADKISAASTIEIEVQDFGLNTRLENSLEITIFRIIQELTTNIIKHANATQANISLTNHNESLNIMIEDNGDGFNTNKVVKNQGMGLHSIEKRVEHLEGVITIESQPKQGTTVIIDIPL